MKESFVPYNGFLIRIVYFIGGVMVALFFAWLGFTALERERKGNIELRAERCAKYGENMPPEIIGYCDGAGQ